MSKTYCNFPFRGMFISNRGMGLCCINRPYYSMSPKEFWYGTIHKTAKKNMTNNLPVNGCQVCYKNEEQGLLSSRNMYQSDKNIPIKDLPTKLDLDFSNFCNLKCIMCSPRRSSQIAKEQDPSIENNGIVTISQEALDETCELSHQLEHLTIQGGEPSIMPEFIYYFEYLKKNNLIGNINLQVITNLTNINGKFYEHLSDFKSVRLSVSIDAFGKTNDYIRFPSKFTQIEKNLKALSNYPSNVNVEILNSIQNLSLVNYGEFLNWCANIEKIYSDKNKNFHVIAMKVTDPKEFSYLNITEQLKNKFINDISDFFSANPNSLRKTGSLKTELDLLKRTLKNQQFNSKLNNKLINKISDIDTKRQIKITNFIPDFEYYF